jgi:hypothetical protein
VSAPWSITVDASGRTPAAALRAAIRRLGEVRAQMHVATADVIALEARPFPGGRTGAPARAYARCWFRPLANDGAPDARERTVCR